MINMPRLNPYFSDNHSFLNLKKRMTNFAEKDFTVKNWENYQDVKEKDKKIAKCTAAFIAAICTSAAALAILMQTDKGQKEINRILNQIDTSENIAAKFVRKIVPKGKLNIEPIGKKTILHMYSSADNVDGLGKSGVSGAHNLPSFVKSFYKNNIKDNIQVTNIKMKDKKIKDGNIIIEYLEDNTPKTLETNIGKGFTKGQQKLLRNLSDPKANNGFVIKNYTKSKFYQTYLAQETQIKGEKNSFSDIYKTLFCKKPTGEIDLIKKDPFVEGVYSVKYHKLTGGNSFPEKTVFIDRQLSSEEKRKLRELCSKNIPERIIGEIENGENLYNSENLIASVQNALKKGVIKENKNGETIILAHRAGTMFAAYCEKTKNNSYKVKSFFPVLHGSEMHKNIIKDYLNRKGNIDFFDMPKLVGLKIEQKFYNNFKKGVFKKSIMGTAAIAQTQTMFQDWKQKKNTKARVIN